MSQVLWFSCVCVCLSFEFFKSNFKVLEILECFSKKKETQEQTEENKTKSAMLE